MPPCNTGQLPVCACGWNFMSLKETWPRSLGGQNWQGWLPGQTPTPGEGELLVLPGQPQPEGGVCVCLWGVCFGETRAFFVCFPGVFPASSEWA